MKEKIIKNKLQKYSDLNNSIDKASEDIRIKREAFEDSIVGLKLIKEKLEVAQLEVRKEIEEIAEEEFIATGKKKFFNCIGIRVMTDLEYNEEVALSWAKEKDLCLKLDIAAFKKLAKTNQLEFVTKKERVQVTLPKDTKAISEFLEANQMKRIYFEVEDEDENFALESVGNMFDDVSSEDV